MDHKKGDSLPRSEDQAANAAKKEFCGFPSVSDYTTNGLKNIVEANKTVSALPSGSSRDLYTAHPAFTRLISSQSERLLNIIQHTLQQNNITGSIVRRDDEEKFELLQECNDSMLERINSNLDDLDGIKKNPQTILVQTQLETPREVKSSGSWNNAPTSKFTPSAPVKSAKLLTAKNITRPQINFKVPVDNRASVPFVPKIKEKPNSLKPLAILPEYDDDGNICSYLHPYEFELDKFEPPPSQLTEVVPIKPLSLDVTPLIHIDTESQLKELLADLMKAPVIAVDLEHHSYRTFQGITCLMQISTREKDYIVDTLALREELHILNEVFTKPSVVKVFHGANCDIEWLQRDLSLYVVNMFDTHQAAKRLGFARLSLAFLLKHYCDIDADKTFQLADWRIRPLPEELVYYARQDTHYLLYIYDLLRNELLTLGNGQPNILKMVIQLSTDICKIKYVKHVIDDESHVDLYNRSKRLFDNRQLFALKEIYAWRDKIARLEDESYGYVLPNHMILQISDRLPREMQGILACCNPIPPLVKQHLNVLHAILLKARQQSMAKPIPLITIQRDMSRSAGKDSYFDNPIFCRFDTSRDHELRDDLPTILNNPELQNTKDISKFLKSEMPSIAQEPQTGVSKENMEKVEQIRKEFKKFLTPYQRYLQILPFVEEEKLKAEALVKHLASKKKLCPDVIVKTSEVKMKDTVYSTPPAEERKRKYSEANDTPLKQQLAKRFKPVVAPPKHETPAKKETSEIKLDLDGSSDEGSSSDNQPSNEQSTSAAVKQEERTGKLQKIVDNLNTNGVANMDNADDKYGQNSGVTETKNQKKKRLKKNRKQLMKPSDFRQNSNKSVPFDYTKVDFKKFQGGSQKYENVVLKNNKNKGGKKVNINAKKLDNMFSFSNVKIKKV